MSSSAKYHQKTKTWDYPSGIEKVKHIIDVKKLKNKKILDIGCGDGRFAKEVFDISSTKVFGIETNKSALAKAKRYVYPKFYDIEKGLPYPDNSFDSIFFLDTLEHIYDLENIFSHIKRVMRRNAQLVLSLPNSFDLKNRLSILKGKEFVHWAHTKYAHRSYNYAHIRFLRVKDMIDLLKTQKLYVHKIQYNYNPGGLLPVRLFPAFFRSFLLKCFPNLLSGKFVFLVKKNQCKNIEKIYLDKTNFGL